MKLSTALDWSLIALLSLSVCEPVHPEEWPQFRGPRADGVSSEKGLPSEWSPDKNIAWKVPVAGDACASPINWGSRIYVATAVPDNAQETPKKGLYFGGNRNKPRDTVYCWKLLCFSLDDGSQHWERIVAEGKPKAAIHLKNTYASETPVTDGKHIYLFFGSEGLFCYDMEGELKWKKDLGVLETRYGWGTSSSPVLDSTSVYVQCDNEGQSFVSALDKMTGEELWRADRNEGSSWSTPFLWKHDAGTELVTCATSRVRSYDPANGKQLWELSGMSSIVCPTPFSANGLLYVSSGYVGDRKRPIFAVKPGVSGVIAPDENQSKESPIAWWQPQSGPYNPSPIVVDDLMYVLYDRGFFACYDALTGKEVYGKKRIGSSTSFTSSPWSYDGKIFCLSEDGDTTVIAAGREFKVLGRNSLDEMFMTSPAISHGAVILRGQNHLYCIRTPKP